MYPPPAPESLPTVLVLASGRGARFLASGGKVHKLQADLAGATVLERTLETVKASGLAWHVEDRGLPGMGDSIAAAVAATAGANGWLVLPADLPLVLPETLRMLAFWHTDCEVLVPVFEGQRGHPVRFCAGCRADLMALRGSSGAARVMRVRTVSELPMGDAGCVTDIDTVDDLHRVRTLWAARRTKR